VTVGTLVLGLLNGLTIGLLAVGLVLVYKSNRFLNLAHAQLGTLSALLLAKFVLEKGWNWWLAFAVAIAVGVVTGVLMDVFLVAPLRRRGGTPMRLLLLSLAGSQLLLGLTFFRFVAPSTDKVQLYPQPFHSDVRVGGVVLSGMSILTAVLIPVLVISLALFMRYSPLGRQIRAAANNPEAARTCGISVDRISGLTWAMAGGLSAVSAVLQAPTQPNFNVAALGPYLLMLTLGAAAFGAFVSLPAALGGGIVLGVVSQIVTAETSNGSDGELALFVMILLIVLVRGRAIGRVFAMAGGAIDALPITRVPDNLRGSGLVRFQRLWLALFGTAIALAVPMLPYFNTNGHRFVLTEILIYALIGVGLTVLVGWGGQVSLGHFAVIGLMAFAAAKWSAHHWSLPAMMLLAGVIGAAVMVLIGLPALRVGGLTLTVTTMGFAVICSDWVFHQDWGGSARSFANIVPTPLGRDLGTPSSQLAVYLISLVVLLLGVAGAGVLRRLGPGRLVIAVRDNERAASAFGIAPPSVKLTILAVSGLYAGVAGVLWGEAWRVASPEQFPADLSLAIVAIPVIGGLGSVGGAVLAAVTLYASTFFVGPHVSALFGSFGQSVGFQLFLGGIGQVVVLMQAPNGMAGAVQAKWQSYLDRRSRWMAGWGQLHPFPEEPEEAAAATPAPAERTAVDVKRAPAPRRLGWRGAAESDDLPLVASGVRMHFGGVVALDGAEIAVKPGEIVGLIGPNGAGKTTLINVISGVLRADAGSLRVFGQEVADLPADFRAALGVARSFQDARLFPGLTVVETIQVALAYGHKVGTMGALVGAPWVRAEEFRSRTEAERIAERFGLGPFKESLTQELSTGSRRICDLAAQVATRPKLLLLDEPTGGVAQREAEVFGPLLRGIRDELGCAVVIVEHDMPLLMGLCDRVYAMEAGRVIAEGTPEQIRHDPHVVASYLGTDETAVARSGGTSADKGEPATLKRRSRARTRPAADDAPTILLPTQRPTGDSREPVLRADSIEFSYGKLQVLFGISLDVMPGEALALLGTNGAGKSTLLRVLAGLASPSGGAVHLDGQCVTGVPAEKLVGRGVVLISGGRAVFTDMTIEENLQMQAISVRKRPGWVAERRDLVLETFPRLAERLTQQAGTLSGGEQQQLAVAKALMLDPKVLCIDELSLGLAPVVVGELLGIVKKIHESGVTLVLVEQSLNIAASVCERAVFLEKGQVRFEGRTAELLERDDIARAVFLGGAAS
jgi:ABC-type branched-subunit amino acid transport system ATPase component/ABC-type branched-subunit amino acid transport system permease subunit